MSLLRTQWSQRGLTVVLVTHDSAIAAYAQRVATMNDGHLSLALTPEEH